MCQHVRDKNVDTVIFSDIVEFFWARKMGTSRIHDPYIRLLFFTALELAKATWMMVVVCLSRQEYYSQKSRSFSFDYESHYGSRCRWTVLLDFPVDGRWPSTAGLPDQLQRTTPTCLLNQVRGERAARLIFGVQRIAVYDDYIASPLASMSAWN